MRLTCRMWTMLLIWPLLAAAAHAQSEADKAARAQELIKKARAALGGEALFKGLQSLSASGHLRRHIKFVRVSSPEKVEEKEATLKGKVEFDFLLPDKFRKREKGSDAAGWPFDRYEIVNGKEAWLYPPPPAPSTHKNRMVVNADEAERSYEQQGQAARADLSLFALTWLFTPLPSYPLEMSYEGEANTESERAYVIAIKGPDGFGAVLLLDRQTYRPVTLLYVMSSPLREEIVVSAVGFNRRYIAQTFARARREAAMRAKPPRRVEVRINFSDHRPVRGLMLPHKMTTLYDGRLATELEISGFALNGKVDAKKFEARQKR